VGRLRLDDDGGDASAPGSTAATKFSLSVDFMMVSR
jgi:hypothetical protein